MRQRLPHGQGQRISRDFAQHDARIARRSDHNARIVDLCGGERGGIERRKHGLRFRKQHQRRQARFEVSFHNQLRLAGGQVEVHGALAGGAERDQSDDGSH